MTQSVKKWKNVSNILSNPIHLSGTISESIVDGPGIRFVIFTQGCPKRCFMCHNEETQSLTGGFHESMDKLVSQWRKNPLLSGITISGGEPFLQPKEVLYLIDKALETNLNIVVYSGFYYEELLKMKNKYIQEILAKANYLIDGPFEHQLKNLNLLFRGSSNQRIIDLKETINQQELITIESFN